MTLDELDTSGDDTLASALIGPPLASCTSFNNTRTYVKDPQKVNGNNYNTNNNNNNGHLYFAVTYINILYCALQGIQTMQRKK